MQWFQGKHTQGKAAISGKQHLTLRKKKINPILPQAESRISGNLHHLLHVDQAGYPALLWNSHLKGIKVTAPARVSKPSTGIQPCTSFPKGFGSDLAPPGRLNWSAPGEAGMWLKIGGWLLEAAKSKSGQVLIPEPTQSLLDTQEAAKSLFFKRLEHLQPWTDP